MGRCIKGEANFEGSPSAPHSELPLKHLKHLQYEVHHHHCFCLACWPRQCWCPREPRGINRQNSLFVPAFVHLVSQIMAYIPAEILAAACTGSNHYDYYHCCKYYANGASGEVINGGLLSPDPSRSIPACSTNFTCHRMQPRQRKSFLRPQLCISVPQLSYAVGKRIGRANALRLD